MSPSPHIIVSNNNLLSSTGAEKTKDGRCLCRLPLPHSVSKNRAIICELKDNALGDGFSALNPSSVIIEEILLTFSKCLAYWVIVILVKLNPLRDFPILA